MVICRADRAAISYINESGELRLLKHRGLSEEYVRDRQLTRLDPTLSGMMTTRLPLIIEDIDEFANTSPNYPVWKKEGIASIVTLPLVSEGDVFGVIGAGSLSVRRYSKTETDAMAILATQAGAAVINARLLDQLREANKAKDEFFSTLSHELRTPLTPILGWTHLLKPFAGYDPLLAQGIDTIERNAKQLSELIKDLLDLTRIISNKIELDRDPTDLAALVKTAVAQMLPQAESRGISVEISLPDERSSAPSTRCACSRSFRTSSKRGEVYPGGRTGVGCAETRRRRPWRSGRCRDRGDRHGHGNPSRIPPVYF